MSAFPNYFLVEYFYLAPLFIKNNHSIN